MAAREAPVFLKDEARALWMAYLERVAALAGELPAWSRDDLVAEIERHLLDALCRGPDPARWGEPDEVAGALERLGDPAEFVPDLVTDRLTALAMDRPHRLWLMLRLRGLGWRYLLASAVLGLGYMFAFWLLLLAVLKPFFPDNVGLFILPNGYWFPGIADGATAGEVLGDALIPVHLLLYLVLQWLLAVSQRKVVKYIR